MKQTRMSEFKPYMMLFIITLSILGVAGKPKCNPEKNEYYHRQAGVCLLCETCLKGEEPIPMEMWDAHWNPEVGPTECRRCRRCQPGMFSETRSFKCKPCKNCALYGQYESTPCSSVRDTICDGVKPTTISVNHTPTPKIKSDGQNDDNSKHLNSALYIVGFICVMIFLVLFLLMVGHYVKKKKFRKGRNDHSSVEEPKANSAEYKERLQTKYIKSLKPEDTSKSLLGKDWIFVKDGLDDFRDGLPPPVKGDILIKGSKGPGPSLKGSSENVSPVKQPAVRNRFSKHQICYSRSTPLQQNRRDHIDEIEYSLVLHPLALYPHLEESVPPELFEDIVDIIDPEMNLDPDEEFSDQLDEEEEEDEEGEVQRSPKEKDEDVFKSEGGHSQDSDEPRIRNPYRWLPRKDEKDKKDKKKTSDKSASSESQEEHIKKVTKDFCDWVAESLGGDQNKFEESTIMSLFASGYETKPALSVPIHVVELTNVPQELRQQATVSNQQTNKNIPPPEKASTNWKYSGQYEPSWVKFKYGAWYLDPVSWSKRRDDEPLENPKDIKDKEMSEAKKKSKELNHVIAQSQGAKLFMDWVNDPKRQIDPKSEHAKPEFLDEVAKIQEQAVIEEQKRLKAEQDAKQRKLYTRKRTETEQSVA